MKQTQTTHRRQRAIVSAIAAFGFMFSAAAIAEARAQEPVETVRHTEVFGTQVTIIVSGVAEEKAADAIGKTFAHFERMYSRFHGWRGGELSDLNKRFANDQLPATVTAPLAEMMSLAIDYGHLSNGLFNAAGGKLYGMWGFHKDRPQGPPPSDEAIQEFLKDSPDMRDVVLQGRVVHSAPRQSQMDFGGLAKGVALDAARDILRANGVSNALVNVGGNIIALGKKGDRHWRVQISTSGKTVELKDGEAVATSGGSARFYVYEGKRYYHIINPRTGYSAYPVFGASTISADPQQAGVISDAAATSLVIARDQEAKEIARNFKLASAWQTDEHGNTHALVGER